VLKKKNLNLLLTLLATPATTSVLATTYFINILLIPLAPLKPKKRVYFAINYFVYLFSITRAYAMQSLELAVLELTTKLARLILLPNRTIPLLLLTIKSLFTKEY
jgi:hypothetical protein